MRESEKSKERIAPDFSSYYMFVCILLHIPSNIYIYIYIYPSYNINILIAQIEIT
jgi:hypothetical protein